MKNTIPRLGHPKPHTTFRWLLAAAAAAPVLGLVPSVAWAQYPVNNGNARDANNRVGSGGRAENSLRGGPGVTPDMIVNGNVTGNKYFRGPTASTDARAFRGPVADNVSSTFVRDSTGGFDRNPGAESFQARPFYGDNRAVAPPPGYVPRTTTVGNPWAQTSNYDNPLSAAALPGLSTGEGLIPRLGTASSILSAPISGQQLPGSPNSYLLMSPLGGIRQVTDAGEGSDFILTRNAETTAGAGGDRYRNNAQLVDQMRTELQPGGDPRGPVKAGGAQGDAGQPQQTDTQTLSGGQPLGSMLAQPLGRPLGAAAETPTNKPLGSSTLAGGQTLGTAPLGSTVGTGQSIRRMLPTPSEQMEQYSELEKRFRQSQGTDKPLTDQEALQRLREMKPVNPNMTNPLAPKRDNASDARPGGTGAPPAAAPGGTGTAPGAPAAAPGGARAEPLAIKSLATGVRSKTLAQVLTSAEDQMRQGKYADALNQYTLAEQAAPNNGLITLGRANAELGSSSYRTAESHLRQAYGSNGALLLGRYDLRSMIGADRLTAVTKDLTDLSAKEQKETMAPFLLAYISFNTGDAATAEKYLDEVDRRAGAPDPLVKQMRQLWAAGDAGSRNK